MVVKENRKDVRYLPDESKTKTHEVQEASCLLPPSISHKCQFFHHIYLFVNTNMLASMLILRCVCMFVVFVCVCVFSSRR